MKKLILLMMLSVPVWTQTSSPPSTLQVTRIYTLTSATQVIDNRSNTRQMNVHSFCATGSGSWSMQLEYSDTSASGPWTSFGSSSSVTNSSTSCVGTAIGYHAWIRLNPVSGSPSATYSGWKDAFIAQTPTALGVTSVFGRAGAVTAQTGDYTAAQVTNAVDQTGSYTNPAWITSLSAVKLTNFTVVNDTNVTGSFTAGTFTLGWTGTLANARLTNSSLSFNGQSVSLGSSGNVNSGASAHSVALNQGNGSAITGLLLAAHQVPVGATSADPSGKTVPDCQDTGGNHLNFTQSTDTFSCGTSGGGSSNSLIRSFGATFDGGGSALTAGATATVYTTIPFACTIAAYNITVDTGTASLDLWKVATGTAIPTSSNTILSGGYMAISTGTALHSTSLGIFTSTAVSANDIVGINLHAVSSATKVDLKIQCNAS